MIVSIDRLQRHIPFDSADYIMTKYAKKYMCQEGAISLWSYDDLTGTVLIFTNRPGTWIGRAGGRIEQLKVELDKCLVKARETREEVKRRGHVPYGPDLPEQINIRFVECANYPCPPIYKEKK